MGVLAAGLRTPRRAAAGCTRLVPQRTLDRSEDFLLPRFVGDVEQGEAAIGEPDVRDDLSVGVVVEVKKRSGTPSEAAGSAFTQLAERAQLVQETGETFESSSAAQSRRCLNLGHVATPVAVG